jgi:hypothetical protein
LAENKREPVNKIPNIGKTRILVERIKKPDEEGLIHSLFDKIIDLP